MHISARRRMHIPLEWWSRWRRRKRRQPTTQKNLLSNIFTRKNSRRLSSCDTRRPKYFLRGCKRISTIYVHIYQWLLLTRLLTLQECYQISITKWQYQKKKTRLILEGLDKSDTDKLPLFEHTKTKTKCVSSVCKWCKSCRQNEMSSHCCAH